MPKKKLKPGRKKKQKNHILIVDDEKNLRDSIAMLLQKKYNLHLAKNGKEAVEIVKNHPIDLVLLDIRLPEIDGIEILKLIKGIDDTIEVIMLTAVIMVGKAVAAMRAGAYDYITKPFEIATLQVQIEKALEKRRLLKENLSLKKIIEEEHEFEKIIGKNKEIKNIIKTIDDVAKSKASVLISGESGTGKELIAKAIHNRSPRKDKLFVAINCAAIPENLLESELFGHERGSFTGATERQIGKFEIAHGGTLFLDEIGSLPMPMQAKILRAIQEREIERIGSGYPTPIDVRIIAASNTNLRQAIKNYKFREDLFYRLNVIPIHMPPLRDRKEDIPLLTNHFLKKNCQEFGKKIKGIKKEVMEMLIAYRWPGNIRELQNLIERLVVLSKTDHIGQEHLPKEINVNKDILDVEAEKDKLFDAVQQFEAEFIQRALRQTGGKKGKAAKLMGVHRNTLVNMERRYGLQHHRRRPN